MPCRCQQNTSDKSSVADVVAKLHSHHLSERIDVLDEIASDQALLRSGGIQATLLNLLDQETEMFREDKGVNSVAAADTEDSGEEENSQYLSSLSTVVNMFVDWGDPRQACTMVYAGDITYPASVPQAAGRARAVLPCLLKRAKSKFALYREIASPMLVEAICKAQGTLDREIAVAAREMVLSDVRDSDVGVRSATVLALGEFGETDMIPALEELAANDPSPEVEGHSIRKSAALAIAKIQKREPHNAR